MAEPKTKEISETDGSGCQHYKRRCAFISPCCKKAYICRICHDEKEKHEINRHMVKQVKCLQCQHVQPVKKDCEKCGICFGKYFCAKCRLFDDTDKGQFHCDACGICRIGGSENFFHCTKCDSCLGLALKDDHKCIEKATRSNCPICLEDLHTSRNPIDVPRCGHFIHKDCMKDMLKSGNFSCPICGESYHNMETLWKLLDAEIINTPMPDEYKDFLVQILCKDCHKESRTLFHVIGLKCGECGSYNTCRTAEPEPEPEVKNTSTDSNSTPEASSQNANEVGSSTNSDSLPPVTAANLSTSSRPVANPSSSSRPVANPSSSSRPVANPSSSSRPVANPSSSSRSVANLSSSSRSVTNRNAAPVATNQNPTTASPNSSTTEITDLAEDLLRV